MSVSRCLIVIGCLLPAWLAGCRKDEEIRVYQVAKEDSATVIARAGESPAGEAAAKPAGNLADPHAGVPGAPPLGATGGGDPHAGVPGAPALGGGGGDPHAGVTPGHGGGMGGGGPKVKDAPPAHWVTKPGSSMRRASYQLEGEGGATLDISLIMLRGAAVGTLENVNLWRSQVGLEPVDQEGLEMATTRLTTPLGEGVLVDFEGLPAGADPAKDGRILGVIAKAGKDAWFYKLRGNAALAAKEKEAFLAWVASVRVDESAPPAEPAKPAEPAAAEPAAPPPPPAGLEWKLPDGWKAGAAKSGRHATLLIGGADGAGGELAVTSFPGDVGGDLANVNRWRGQVGAEPVKETELAPLVQRVPAGDKEFQVIDVKGPATRLAAGWVRHGEATWFFKLTGPDALVAAEKDKFIAFLGSVRFMEEAK